LRAHSRRYLYSSHKNNASTTHKRAGFCWGNSCRDTEYLHVRPLCMNNTRRQSPTAKQLGSLPCTIFAHCRCSHQASPTQNDPSNVTLSREASARICSIGPLVTNAHSSFTGILRIRLLCIDSLGNLSLDLIRSRNC